MLSLFANMILWDKTAELRLANADPIWLLTGNFPQSHHFLEISETLLRSLLARGIFPVL